MQVQKHLEKNLCWLKTFISIELNTLNQTKITVLAYMGGDVMKALSKFPFLSGVPQGSVLSPRLLSLSLRMTYDPVPISCAADFGYLKKYTSYILPGSE